MNRRSTVFRARLALGVPQQRENPNCSWKVEYRLARPVFHLGSDNLEIPEHDSRFRRMSARRTNQYRTRGERRDNARNSGEWRFVGMQEKHRLAIQSLSLQLCVQERIKLHPYHIGFGDTGDVTRRALSCFHHSSCSLVRRLVMTERKEAPIMCVAKTFAVFHHDVQPVQGAWKISAARCGID
jgi:hypothetical protein